VATIIWFEDYQPADAPVVGGKNSSLGTLFNAGLPVPPGFAVSADCYRKAMADGGLAAELDALTAGLDPRDHTAVTAAGFRARELIGSLDLTGGLIMAERVAFAASDRIGLVEAQRLVSAAAARTAADGVSFRQALVESAGLGLAPDEIDAALDPATGLEPAASLVDRVLST